MLLLSAIDHIVLRVTSLDSMARFYCDVLGCIREREVEELDLVQLRAGGSLIDLVAVHGELGKSGGIAPGHEGRNYGSFLPERFGGVGAGIVCLSGQPVHSELRGSDAVWRAGLRTIAVSERP